MRSKIVKTIFTLMLIAALLLAGISAFSFGYRYVRSQDAQMNRLDRIAEENNGALVNEDTEGAVKVFIPRSAEMEEIAQILSDQGLISNTIIFRIMSKFNGFDGHYQAGTHYLLPTMSYDEIMYSLTRQPEALKITFLEGDTYQVMKKRMKDAGLNIDEERMDDLVRHPNEFLDYSFVRDLVADPRREWLLQGYLWPDTYLFDPNLDEISILRMFLDNTERKLAETDYVSRAASMNMSLDEVLTIASIVQVEGNISEMSKIGRVFLNRFNLEMPMESCATINYLRQELGEEPIPWATEKDLIRFKSDPYNTYSNPGLPPGPINNPGTIAIEGILWPASPDTWKGAESYLYFCAKGNGENIFATTVEEHLANVEHFSSLWEAEQDS